jgi:hypothetical protein
MLGRGWGGSAATAVSVAGVGSAAQLGLAYGLGLVAWNPSVDAATGGAWLAGLAWVTWIAGSSTLLGAAVADRLAGGRPGGAPPRGADPIWPVRRVSGAGPGTEAAGAGAAHPRRIRLTPAPATTRGGPDGRDRTPLLRAGIR